MINLKRNDTIVFIGDSITDAGRFDAAYEPFGNGYVHFAANYLLAKYPEYDIGVINTGISGNTVRDLSNRWQKDCLNHKPNILSILIGVNDLCRQYANRLNEAVLLDEYELTYERLLSQAKAKCDRRLILMEPFLFCRDKNNPVYIALQEYIRVVHKLAEKFDAVLVPLQNLIDKKIENVPQQEWSDDMVHPYQWAHSWIAQRWIEFTKL
ncbi:MAG: SGNH/GDSL hydrolase family protein [Sedimentisphaerales bacterium]|nr:SGNH/GDSL hydrolase family protein [Sedimentisphaerales bacterium]